MALTVVGTRNEQNLAAGASSTALRQGQRGQLIAGIVGGKYGEDTLSDQLFHGMTAVTGVAPGTAVGTTAAFALANASGSTKNLVILSARLGYVSGTLGAGVITWCRTAAGGAAVTGTAITAHNGRTGQGNAAVGLPFTTATLPATPTVFRVFGSLLPILATTANNPWILEDLVDGAIVVTPGAAVSLQFTGGAGATPLVVYSCNWLEVPI